jgi:adenine-specific DNA-methyltransferase
MTLGFTYMGTKRQIAGQLAEVIGRAPAGPLLDAFAGISAVGTIVAPRRAVWCNDVQLFPYSVARSYFTARSQPRLSRNAITECRNLFERNKSVLCCSFASALAQERRAYDAADLSQICQISSHLTSCSQSEEFVRLRQSYRLGQRHTPYCLFTMTYAGGYIGLEQALDIDSLRFAVDELERRKTIDADTHRWMLIALCRALGRVSNSTGHFAQYLSVKEHSKHRFLAKRNKPVWLEWQSALDGMRPLGTKEWRRSNRVFQSEAISLLASLSKQRIHPSVIYCDPPYTKNHYSRYYHLLETLLLYDYPNIESKGQYRPDRFYSPFSLKTQVNASFQNLIGAAAQLKSTLILSYPDCGLLASPREVLVRLLRERFSNVEVAAELIHEHSTLGASNGVESAQVKELVFLARP